MAEENIGRLSLNGDTVQFISKGLTQSASIHNVDGVEVGYRSWPALLVFGGVCLLAALWWNDSDAALWGAGLTGVTCIVLFFLTRQSVVTVYAGGMRLRERISGANRQIAIAFISTVQERQLASQPALRLHG